MARVALQRNDVELVAVNDPFITTDYMVNSIDSSDSVICVENKELVVFANNVLCLIVLVDIHVQIRHRSWAVEAF